MVEYPKSVGEKTLSQFEVSDRYPSYSDDLKLRIYTAAHCLDFSLNEEVTLSLFQVNDRLLPKFNDAYLNFKVKFPELEAIKKLRNNLNGKISPSFTSDLAKKIMLSFAPRTRDLEAVFGTVSGGATPTARNRCIIKPENIDGYQYSCATYHDTAVFDVEPASPFTDKQIALLRELRDSQIQLTKYFEARSLFENYVLDSGTRDTINIIFDDQTPAYNPILSTESPCLNDATLNAGTRLFVFKKPPASETNPDRKCVDFPITNFKTARFFTYSIREGMKNF